MILYSWKFFFLFMYFKLNSIEWFLYIFLNNNRWKIVSFNFFFKWKQKIKKKIFFDKV